MAEALRILVMGVSGAGKSTFGAALAEALSLPYLDGDDLHPATNIAKMAAGIPLDDADRAPWLRAVAETFDREAPVVIGCSALKRSYRDILRAHCGGELRIIFLDGAAEVLAARMRDRPGHFMPESLLTSQLATLEPPSPDEGAIRLDLALPLEAQVQIARAALQG